MSARIESYKVFKTGSIRNVQKSEDVPGVLPPGKVFVKVKAIGLNYADLFAIMGLYSATPKTPFIPGLEFSGIVEKSNSPLYNPGQRVIGVTKFGGYASFNVADPAYLMPLPERWSFEEGAAFPVQTLTAYYALVTLGNLQRNQTVLIHSAAGGVGLQANRIAKKYHAYTIGVVGNAEKLKVLKQEGYDVGILRGHGFKSNLKNALAGRELNLVLETTGDKYFRYSYESLAPMGRVVAYGSAQFTPSANRPNYLVLLFKYLFRPRVDPLTMITENKSVMAFNLIWLYERKELMHQLLREISSLDLPPPKVGHQFKFGNLLDALLLFKRGKTTGKVIVNV